MGNAMNFAFDFNSGVPIYRQIIDQVKYMVVSEQLRPGDRILSIRELAKKINVNPTTVMKAYTELTREGVIYQRRGQGCFVSETVSRFSEEEKFRLVDEKVKAMIVEAFHLGLSEGELLERVKQLIKNIKSRG